MSDVFTNMLKNKKVPSVLKPSDINNDNRQTVILPAEQFEPDPGQPRKSFNQVELDELRESIEKLGQIQPIAVRKPAKRGDKYLIVAGERRWRAIQSSTKVTDVVAYVMDSKDFSNWTDTLLVQLEENVRREDISIIDKAEAYKKLVDGWEVTQAEAAKRLHISTSALAKLLALNNATDSVKQLATSGVTKDPETLYMLSRAAKDDPEAVAKFIEVEGAGLESVELKEAARNLLTNLSPSLNNSTSKNERKVKTNKGSKSARDSVPKIHNVTMEYSDVSGLYNLYCIVNDKKTITLNLTPEAFSSLHAVVNKQWEGSSD